MSKIKPTLLIICDGWGEAPPGPSNAITTAKTPNLDRLRARWPHTSLHASGEEVGLPKGQMGNSEVGHLTIGAGKIIRQPLSRQNYEISEGIFAQNEVLISAIELSIQRRSKIHILGLLSSGGVHSHPDGALALVKLSRDLGQKNVFIHAFTDGRDTPPTSGIEHIAQFEAELDGIGAGRIASLAGRYYAMDRDTRWDRIELAYDMLTGQQTHLSAPSATDHLAASYRSGETDEFIKPIRITGEDNTQVRIDDNDVVVFFNFRPDRARQLSYALTDPNFTGFKRKSVIKNLHFVSFAEYDHGIGAPVVFPKDKVSGSLAEIISSAGLKQFHLAETEKYAHVTYYLNGGREVAFIGEDRQLVPSLRIATYDLAPAMSAVAVTEAALSRLESNTDSFIVVNFANADMLGHTGVLPATISAIEVLDECIGKLIDFCLAAGGVAIMTADHGNAEIEIDPATDKPLTSHTSSPVPFLLCGTDAKSLRPGAGLSDVAPTILSVLGLEAPQAMTGKSLILS